jgi:hypothetical protein
MQWSELLATLPPATAVDLVNGLSLGYGQVALAGRRAARGASVTAVERALATALVVWERGVALLPDRLLESWPAPAAPDPATPPDLPSVSWDSLLVTAAAGALDTRLAEAVAAARRSAELAVADAPVADVLAQLATARVAVVAVRDQLLALAQQGPSATLPD